MVQKLIFGVCAILLERGEERDKRRWRGEEERRGEGGGGGKIFILNALELLVS